jgi:hypothetical protein
LKPMEKAIKKRDDAKVRRLPSRAIDYADHMMIGRLRALQKSLRNPPEQEDAFGAREQRACQT